MPTNVLYTISGCPHCQLASRHLDELNVKYLEINLMEEPLYIADVQQLVGEIKTPLFWTKKRIWLEEDILTMRKKDDEQSG